MEKDQKGQATSNAIGFLVENLDEDLSTIEPAFDSYEAMKILARNNRNNLEEVTFDANKDATLEIMLENSLSESVSARLVYKLSYRVLNEKRQSRPFGIIDAESGDVLKAWEGLNGKKLWKMPNLRSGQEKHYNGIGGNVKIGRINFDGKKLSKLLVSELGNNTCTLKNHVAAVYSCNFSWECPEEANQTFQFPCDKGFDDAINGAYSPLSDTLFGITVTYEMFDKWYGISDPLYREKSSGSSCHARVHYGEEFENAFWDGHFITMGDGKDTFFPFTNLDDIAHEIAHGVTEFNSGLIYMGESGGLNEAFSDMAGEAAKFYARNHTDWMSGFDAAKDPEKAMRYFEDPPKDGVSIGHQNDLCPGLDPHYSSGVFNKAFYILAHTKGWNVRTAFHPFVVANELYWLASSTFFEAACGVVQAAKDLEMDVDDVTAAFRGVGVEPCIDTRTGASAMAEVTVPAGHKVIYHFTVKERVNALTVSVYGAPVKMNLHTPSCHHCTWSNNEINRIDICSANVGLHMLEFIPQSDMVKGAVFISEETLTLFKDIEIKNSSDPYNSTFRLPDTITKYGQIVMMELTSMSSGFTYALIKHEGIPKWGDMDHFIPRGGKTIICATKPGTYYIKFFMFGNQPAKVQTLTMSPLIVAKRVDDLPTLTRPPPTVPDNEGSGSTM